MSMAEARMVVLERELAAEKLRNVRLEAANRAQRALLPAGSELPAELEPVSESEPELEPESADGDELSLGNIKEPELLLHICGLLATKDLGRLARTSAAFGRKTGWLQRSAVGGGTEQRSVVEETARRWVVARVAEEQASGGSWLRRMHEMQRPAAVFSRAPGREHSGYIELSQCGAVATKDYGDYDDTWRTAASAVAMRSGRHYAAFTVLTGHLTCFGLIRPVYDVEGREDAQYFDGHCFYDTSDGTRYPGNSDWQGMERTDEGDTIGLLLDLDAGTLAVFKNDDRLGVMATGLKGEYCWAASLYGTGSSARIAPALVPTPEQQAAGEAARRAVFSRSGDRIKLSQRGAVATSVRLRSHYGCQTAASAVAMRGGRHYAAFTMLKGVGMHLGLIRPGFDVEIEESASDVDGHCFFWTGDGHRFPSDRGFGNDWQGMQRAHQGDTIGLLLDLDAGSLTVFRNDERLGVMGTGLGGEYCWAVELPNSGDSVRIAPAPVPAAPTAAEVEAAVSFEAEQPARDAARDAARRREEKLEEDVRMEMLAAKALLENAVEEKKAWPDLNDEEWKAAESLGINNAQEWEEKSVEIAAFALLNSLARERKAWADFNDEERKAAELCGVSEEEWAEELG